jgi:hypothetical protein
LSEQPYGHSSEAENPEVLAERRTGATLGDAKLTTNTLDAGTVTRRA